MATAEFFTCRVSLLPLSFEREHLLAIFNLDDRPLISASSLAVAANGTTQTATITFRRAPTFRSQLKPDNFLPRTFVCAIGGRNVDIEVQIDVDFRGLTPLNTPKDDDAIILVAITGLAGRAFGSWQAVDGSTKPQSNKYSMLAVVFEQTILYSMSPEISRLNLCYRTAMWLRDCLPRDVAHLRIFTYGYPSKLFRSNSTARLLDFTTQFMDELKACMISFKSRRIILIGHSMGCLIIKQALCECELYGFGWLKEAVLAAVFFGPPHRGLNNPQLQDRILGTSPELLVQDLRKGSSLLNHLNSVFASCCRELMVITCFELLASPTIREDENGKWRRDGPLAMMVDRDSACLYIPTEQRIPIHADHSRIAKLLDAPGSEYHSVKDSIAQVVNEVSGIRFHASRLFQYCLDVYKVLLPAVQSADQPLLGDQFRIEIARFELWGRLSEIVVVRPSLGPNTRSEPRLKDAAERMLQLLSDITDERVLLERFGLKAFSYLSDLEPPADEPGTRVLPDAGSMINATYQTLVQNIGLRIRHLQTRSCDIVHIQKVRFLLETLNRTHNSMISILQLAGCQAFDQLLIAALLRTNSGFNLQQLEDSRGIVAPDISRSATFKLLGLEMKSGILQRLKSSSSLKVPPATLDTVKIPKDVSRFATWQTSNDKSSRKLVFIEWRYYDQKAEISRTGDIAVRIDNLMKILTCSPRPTSLCILDYSGYFHDFNNARFGFVCNLPKGVSSIVKQPHQTLDTLLCDNNFKPSLTDRFQLAKKILRCIHQFHLLGWLHKGINSQNILFFESESETSVSVCNPLLTGFDLSREDSPVEISERSPGNELDMYRYSACRFGTTAKYTSSFDIYALGLVLLEIGFWRPLRDLAKSESAERVDKVLPSLVDQARHRTGDRYHKVLQMCIRAPESAKDGFNILEDGLIELDRCVV